MLAQVSLMELIVRSNAHTTRYAFKVREPPLKERNLRRLSCANYTSYGSPKLFNPAHVFCAPRSYTLSRGDQMPASALVLADIANE